LLLLLRILAAGPYLRDGRSVRFGAMLRKRMLRNI
jgi:hypothetical protein